MAVTSVAYHEWGNLKTPRKDIFDVTAQYLDEKPHSAAKAGYVAIDVLNQMGYINSKEPGLTAITRSSLNIFKLSRSPYDFYRTVTNTRKKISDWIDGEKVNDWNQERGEYVPKKDEDRVTAFSDVIRTANDCVPPVAEMGDLASKVIWYIPKEALQTLNGVNGASLAIGMGWNAVDSFNKLANSKLSQLEGIPREKEQAEVERRLLTLIMEVSYVAMGVMVFLTVFFEFVFSPVSFIVLSAITVVTSIFVFYHKNLGEEKKIK